MKLNKRLLVVVLLVFVLLNNSLCSFAAENKLDLNSKVDILNELNIVKGNGVSYDLDSQLSRAQAAAFIVRLLGEEEEVQDNKLKYMTTKFSDVSKEKWYAPYIGYCAEKGIINGYSNSSFGPDDTVGEQAFLKLVLVALGYVYNDDFTWSDVFAFSYGKGLVKDVSYSNGYKGNPKFNRGNVCELIFTALSMKHAETNMRMIERFIGKYIITKDKATEYKLVDDVLETSITSIKAVSENRIEVSFNESIHDFTTDNLLIYKTKDGHTLPVTSINKKEDQNTYIIEISKNQEVDEEYTLLIDRVVDFKGNSSTSFSKKFLGFRAEEVQSDFFKISKVVPVSNNIIYVYFTQPINDNALQTSYYTLLKDDIDVVKGNNSNIEVNKLSTSDNAVAIYFSNYIFTDEEYFAIAIDGNINSSYAVKLNDGKGDKVKFKSVTVANTPFEVDNCIQLNNKTVEIRFNKQVNPIIAKQVFSYYITDDTGYAIRVNNAIVVNEGQGAGKIVRLELEENLKVNKQYNVMINNMQDISRQFTINFKEYNFTSFYYSAKDIVIDAVIPLDESTLIVYIDEPVEQESAQSIANYQIHGVTNTSYVAIPSGVYYNKLEDPNKIKIYLPADKKLKASYTYNFRILTSLKDSMGNYQSTLKNYKFVQNTSISMDTKISEAKVVGENTIKLSFSKEIAKNFINVNNSNYTLTYIDNGLEYNKIPISTSYINPTTIILKFDALDIERQYTITYGKLVDFGNNETINTNKKNKMVVTIGN
ncbi:S-layer homology domain-containing protein [Vallitalea pronyensis]|uniref:S-layer homology domain-containing protein n=1 Tax=Vallitalea pronyensis TaxID=1348613 RepID=A0A8J8MH87_9FIRM|nr:S-layer homology domain-containing protein [Vallitalea pronyensis]QUI21288.1 S-layer homology domain-containing protein [Vallitalea pronyensis]